MGSGYRYVAAIFFCALLSAHGQAARSPYCRKVYESAGAGSAREWLEPRVKALNALGLSNSFIADQIGVSPEYLVKLLAGKPDHIGERTLKKFEKLHADFTRPTEPDRAAGAARVNLKIAAASEGLGELPDLRARRKALYAADPDQVPIPQAVAEATKEIAAAARYYLEDVKIKEPEGLARLFGSATISGNIDGHEFLAKVGRGERFLQADFTGASEIPERLVKVYVNVPQNENLREEVRRILHAAQAGDAVAMKFNAVSVHNLPDRVVVYFAKPQAAFAFAEATAADLRTRGIRGGRMPLAFQVGNSPVAIGVDKVNQSQRGLVSTELARAYDLFAGSPNREELTRRYLLWRDIDPDTWLPSDFANRHRASLTRLAGF